MGRTQPPFTSSIDREVEKLIRLANRLGYPEFKEVVLEAVGRVREFQNALYDEVSDPQEVVLLALISVLAEGRHSGRVRS